MLAFGMAGGGGFGGPAYGSAFGGGAFEGGAVSDAGVADEADGGAEAWPLPRSAASAADSRGAVESAEADDDWPVVAALLADANRFDVFSCNAL